MNKFYIAGVDEYIGENMRTTHILISCDIGADPAVVLDKLMPTWCHLDRIEPDEFGVYEVDWGHQYGAGEINEVSEQTYKELRDKGILVEMAVSLGE